MLKVVSAALPHRPEAFYWRARALQLIDRDDEALADAMRALHADGSYVLARVLRAELSSQEEAKIRADSTTPPDLGDSPGWATAWLDAHGNTSA